MSDSKHKRKNLSEVLTSKLLSGSNNINLDNLKMFDRINEEEMKENLFLESFSDIQKNNTKNQIVECLNINSEDTSVLEGNNLNNLQKDLVKNILMSINSSKSTNKTLIKIITTKFHDLYLKLVNQIKGLKSELDQIKKKSGSAELKNTPENIIPIENPEENLETEALKFLLQEEMECFNQILFDFNVQFNDLQSQEETLRRDILKKHKEIEKLNLDIDECKKQKDSFVRELQNIAVKLNEYKNVTNNFEKIKCKCEKNNVDEMNESNFSSSSKEDDNFEIEEFQLLMNADNREYLIKKILQENKKYKSIVRVMKTEEAEFNNYLMQLEAELENFGKFKNYLLSKVNIVEENVLKCRDKLDGIVEKVINVEFQLEMAEDNLDLEINNK